MSSPECSACTFPDCSPSIIGAPDWKWSIIAPRILGLTCSQSVLSCLVTVTKSFPKNTPVTPSRVNKRFASGDDLALSTFGKSAVPCSITVWPGRNFNVAGFGVDSVWINITIFLCTGFYMPISQRNVKYLE